MGGCMNGVSYVNVREALVDVTCIWEEDEERMPRVKTISDSRNIFQNVNRCMP